MLRDDISMEVAIMIYIEKYTLIFLSIIWLLLVSFNVLGISFILGTPYSVTILNTALFNSGTVLGVLIFVYVSSYFLFGKEKNKSDCAASIFMASPLTLMIGVIPNVSFLNIFFENWVVVMALCFMPYVFWPYFWKSVIKYKSGNFNMLVFVVTIILGAAFIVALDISNIFFLLSYMALISIMVTQLISTNGEVSDRDFNVPFYVFIGFLIFVQFFPTLLNLAGLADTPFRIDVDYDKNNGFLIISFMALMIGTTILSDFITAPLKRQIYSFTIMGALVLSLMAFQAKKHSISTYSNSVGGERMTDELHK
ncbi:MAG: hypothetical protein ACRBB3_09605 [Alphaproteobacteria bacterium]